MENEKVSKIGKISAIVFIFVAILLAIFFMTVGIPTYSIKDTNSENLKIEVGTEFKDNGVQAYLGKTKVGRRIYSESKVNCDKLGDYTITYNAKFLWRKAQKEIHAKVVDTQAPEIELIETDNLTIPGTEYVEEGFKAYDNYDGDITSLVERREDGKEVFYKVIDSSGNVAEATRIIKYKDASAPRITLMGGSTITVREGEKYIEPGFTAIDDVDGDVSENVEIKQSLDTSKTGVYDIEYSVKDDSGNIAKAIRKVIVKKMSVVPVRPVIPTKPAKPNGKVVYLTFDDGPSRHTPRLLNILKKYNVKATFFVVGSGKREYLDDIVNAGHSIGLHTMTHDYAKVYSKDDVFMKEIYDLRRIVYNHTGVDTTMVRFPGGSSNTISKRYNKGIMTRLVNRLTTEGYQYYDWNVSSGDAGETTSSWKVYNNVISGVRNQNMSIVLQHDSKGYSVDATENIIKWCLSHGYTLKSLTPDGPTVHHPIHN